MPAKTTTKLETPSTKIKVPTLRERLQSDLTMDIDGLNTILTELDDHHTKPDTDFIVTIMRAMAQRLTGYADNLENPLA